MFGKTMRVSDELMFRYYELLTDKLPQQIQALKADVESGKVHPRQAKVDLAKTLVTRFHSGLAANVAEDEFNRIFVDKGVPDKIEEVVVGSQVSIGLAQLMTQTGMTASNGEAVRLITGGAVQIDQQKISDAKLKLELKIGESFILKAGKKKFIKIRVQNEN